jgi:FHS family L-fucose permease-like MFS transporter
MALGAPVSAPKFNGNPTLEKNTDYTPALTTLTVLFFMMGFITCLNDILIPYLKSVFSLNYTEAMLVQFCFFTAYLIVSYPSSTFVQKFGYKKGIIAGFILAGVGCLLFYPAAEIKSYPVFLGALFVLASGITLLQVAGNPYVAILGRPETASSRLTLTQAFNSLGTTVAPILGSVLILSAIEGAGGGAEAVQLPYLGLAGALFVIAICMSVVKLPAIQAETEDFDIQLTGGKAAKTSAWDYRHLIFGALGIFAYVGGEVAIGSLMVNFLAEPHIAGLTEVDAGYYVSFYWGGAMVGRFIGAAVLQKVNPGKVLAFTALFVIALIIAGITLEGKVAMWSLLSVGLFNSIMFATIFTLAIAGLGQYTNQGSGILCMAIVGGAVVPLLQGMLADTVGLQPSYIIPAICYAYIAWYGIKGHKSK